MKKILEKLGIPEGIEKQANVLYQSVIDKLNEIVISKDLDEPIEIGKFNIKIKDLEFDNIPFVLFLEARTDVDKPILVNLGCAKGAKFITSNKKLKILRDISTAHFRITLAVPVNVKSDDIVSHIKENLEANKIAHELMHLYEAYKNKYENITIYADYQSYQQMMMLSHDIVHFMYLLYYMSTAENLVRPSELYLKLLKDDVSKDNFLQYMKSSDMMKTIEDARTFSLKEFREKLNSDEKLKEFIKDAINDKDYKSIGDTADDVLNILFMSIANNSLKFINNVLGKYVSTPLSDNFFGFIVSLIGGKSDEQEEKEEIAQKTIQEISNSYKKYVNKPKKYFEKLEKSLNFAGEKMKRKLYKLYDMVKDSTKTKSDSVLNWDLHTKISSKKNESIKYVLNFDDFKIKIGKK